MDFIKQYDYDSLNYLDTEYDHPMVQAAVMELVSAEMRSFTPSAASYLANLPAYPQLKFGNSVILQNEYKRVSKGGQMEKLDLSRYTVDKPEGALDKDVQAWRTAVTNAKAQSEHQRNRQLNLDIYEKLAPQVFIHQNALLEAMSEQLRLKTEEIEQQSRHVNAERKKLQEQSRSQIERMTRRRDEAIGLTWAIKSQCDALENETNAKRQRIDSEK